MRTYVLLLPTARVGEAAPLEADYRRGPRRPVPPLHLEVEVTDRATERRYVRAFWAREPVLYWGVPCLVVEYRGLDRD